MTNIYYDTEFIDDGKTIDLISIGMVSEDGREYYAVSCEFDLDAFRDHDWLMENVGPSLPMLDFGSALDLSHPDVKSRAQIRDEVWAFMRDTPKPELWAWYGAYDHVALTQLFGTMMQIPTCVPRFTSDIRTLALLHPGPKFPKQASGEHNALEDARYNKVKYDWIMSND